VKSNLVDLICACAIPAEAEASLPAGIFVTGVRPRNAGSHVPDLKKAGCGERHEASASVISTRQTNLSSFPHRPHRAHSPPHPRQWRLSLRRQTQRYGPTRCRTTSAQPVSSQLRDAVPTDAGRRSGRLSPALPHGPSPVVPTETPNRPRIHARPPLTSMQTSGARPPTSASRWLLSSTRKRAPICTSPPCSAAASSLLRSRADSANLASRAR